MSILENLLSKINLTNHCHRTIDLSKNFFISDRMLNIQCILNTKIENNINIQFIFVCTIKNYRMQRYIISKTKLFLILYLSGMV